MAAWLRWLAVAVLVGAPPQNACATPQAAGRAPVAALKDIAQDPAAWLDKDVGLVGTLENRGSNYFTDLRVVLRDEDGHAVAVMDQARAGGAVTIAALMNALEAAPAAP